VVASGLSGVGHTSKLAGMCIDALTVAELEVELWLWTGLLADSFAGNLSAGLVVGVGQPPRLQAVWNSF
jgi:hypothetical protein